MSCELKISYYSSSSSIFTHILPDSIFHSYLTNFIDGSSSYSPVLRSKRQSWQGQIITVPSRVPVGFTIRSMVPSPAGTSTGARGSGRDLTPKWTGGGRSEHPLRRHQTMRRRAATRVAIRVHDGGDVDGGRPGLRDEVILPIDPDAPTETRACTCPVRCCLESREIATAEGLAGCTPRPSGSQRSKTVATRSPCRLR